MPTLLSGFTKYPQRTQPATFSEDMDTHIAELANFVTEANAAALEISANTTDAANAAASAQASADAAASIVNIVMWASGATFAKGGAARSPSNLQIYLRKSAGGGTTDPALDPANWQLAFPSLDASGSLNYGITANPLFRMYWGGDTDLGWKTICTVSFSTGIYTGCNFEVDLYEAWYSSSTLVSNKHRFSVVMCRSEAVDLDQDTAVIKGTVANKYLRVVKTVGNSLSSVYELQVRQETNNRHMEVFARKVSSSGATLSWATDTVAGSTGTVYTAALTTADFAGGVTFGNAEVTNANCLDWYEEGNYTGTATGLTTVPTGTINFIRIGKQITLQIPASFTGTSNATTFTITGMPTNIRPSATRYVLVRTVDAGGSIALANATITSAGVINLYKDLAAGVFTNTGTKTLSPQDNITYLI